MDLLGQVLFHVAGEEEAVVDRTMMIHHHHTIMDQERTIEVIQARQVLADGRQVSGQGQPVEQPQDMLPAVSETSGIDQRLRTSANGGEVPDPIMVREARGPQGVPDLGEEAIPRRDMRARVLDPRAEDSSVGI